MQTFTQVTSNPIVVIILGTLPVLPSILWGIFQNKEQFALIHRRLERMEDRLGKMDETLHGIDKRLVVVETRLDGHQSKDYELQPV